MTYEPDLGQHLARAEAVGKVAVIENPAVPAVGADGFERRAMPDEIIDRFHPSDDVLILF